MGGGDGTVGRAKCQRHCAAFSVLNSARCLRAGLDGGGCSVLCVTVTGRGRTPRAPLSAGNATRALQSPAQDVFTAKVCRRLMMYCTPVRKWLTEVVLRALRKPNSARAAACSNGPCTHGFIVWIVSSDVVSQFFFLCHLMPTPAERTPSVSGPQSGLFSGVSIDWSAAVVCLQFSRVGREGVAAGLRSRGAQ